MYHWNHVTRYEPNDDASVHRNERERVRKLNDRSKPRWYFIRFCWISELGEQLADWLRVRRLRCANNDAIRARPLRYQVLTLSNVASSSPSFSTSAE